MQEKTQEFEERIQDCLEQEAKNTINLIGMQGGYVLLPQKFITTRYSDVAYAYYDGESTLLSLEELEKNINTELEYSIPLCTNFDNKTVNQTDLLEIDTKIFEDHLFISLKYPIEVTLGKAKAISDRNYITNLNVRLGYIYSVVEKILTQISNAELTTSTEKMTVTRGVNKFSSRWNGLRKLQNRLKNLQELSYSKGRETQLNKVNQEMYGIKRVTTNYWKYTKEKSDYRLEDKDFPQWIFESVELKD